MVDGCLAKDSKPQPKVKEKAPLISHAFSGDFILIPGIREGGPLLWV